MSLSVGAVEEPDVVKEFRKYEDRIVMFRPTFLKSPFEDQVQKTQCTLSMSPLSKETVM